VGDIWLVRHGATEWSTTMRHTGRTDVPLTDDGRAAARRLTQELGRHEFAAVLSSPLQRARETAQLAGFAHLTIEPDLAEWDYGEFEGRTTDDIRADGPEWSDWTVFRGPIPGGETVDEVAERTRRVLARVDAVDGDVLCFAHAHVLRVFAAITCGLEPHAAARVLLDPATISVIGTDRGERAIRSWNRHPIQ
jgi:broad specificity phosphatase PhoE